MEYGFLGESNLRVSKLGLGVWSSGVLTESETTNNAESILGMYLDYGGNFLDTAASYGNGLSETILGNYLYSTKKRQQVVVSTKAGITYHEGRKVDCSSKAILAELEGSLKRLKTDYIDLWQTHTWDSENSIYESLVAFDKAVSSGKVRYVGVCNYSGWQTALAFSAQKQSSNKAFLASTQFEYSLLNRFVEREVIPFLRYASMGLIAWSPLAGGVLTGKYLNGTPKASRGDAERWKYLIEPYISADFRSIMQLLLDIASETGLSMAQVALLWLKSRDHISSILIGASSVMQLDSLLKVSSSILDNLYLSQLDEGSNRYKFYNPRSESLQT
jgi:aryl-alcohol dehydrogenase-like predicted oxidoreductase